MGIGTDRGLGELPVKPATPTNLRAPFSTKMLAHTSNFEESGVSQQPLVRLAALAVGEIAQQRRVRGGFEFFQE
jgi:hypothetical protein